MMSIVPYILPLIGFFFLVLGLLFALRARFDKHTEITFRTRRKLGLIYLFVGAVLAILGIARL